MGLLVSCILYVLAVVIIGQTPLHKLKEFKVKFLHKITVIAILCVSLHHLFRTLKLTHFNKIWYVCRL